MRNATSTIMALVAVIAFAGLALALFLNVAGPDDVPGPGPGPDDVPDPEQTFPEGILVDLSEGTVSTDSEVDWHITDLLDTSYVKVGYQWVPNEGTASFGTTVHLDPGMYRVDAGGTVFDITVPGTISRSMEWDYILEGVTHRISIDYVIDAWEVSEQRSRSMEYNREDRKYLFAELPELVEVTDSIRGLESSMRAEFVSIGGDPEDGQAYADFLASLPQVAVTYPSRVSVDDVYRGEDYSLYGLDEYWARPLETLVLQYGDCDDTAALACALFIAAGYDAAMGGHSGHVYAGVALENFVDVPEDDRRLVNPYNVFSLAKHTPVEGSCTGPLSSTIYYAVETTKKQIHVGYLTSGDRFFGTSTLWGTAGFYPVQGAESGIHGSS